MATSGADLLANRDALAAAVELAFSSLGYPVDRIVRVASRRFARGKSSLRAWARWRATVIDELAEDEGRDPWDSRDEEEPSTRNSIRRVTSIPSEPCLAVASIAPVCCDCLERLGYAAIADDDDKVPISERWKVEQLRRVQMEASTRMVDRGGHSTRTSVGGHGPGPSVGGGEHGEVDVGSSCQQTWWEYMVDTVAGRQKAAGRRSSTSNASSSVSASGPDPVRTASHSDETTAPAPEILFVMSGANELKWLEAQKVLAEWSTLIVPHP